MTELHIHYTTALTLNISRQFWWDRDAKLDMHIQELQNVRLYKKHVKI